MEGETLVWFQYALESSQFTNCKTFVRALLMRFGPIAYDDLIEALTHLKQTTTVVAYKAQFEALSNRLRGLLDHHKLICFMSDLNDEVRLTIEIFNPLNLSATYGLGKIRDEYLASTRKTYKPMLEKSVI